MDHILRVSTDRGYDGQHDHGYFLAHKLEDAITCAKARKGGCNGHMEFPV